MDIASLRARWLAATKWFSALQLSDFWPRQRVRRPVDVSRFVLTSVALVVLLVVDLVATDWLRGLARAFPPITSGLLRGLLSLVNVGLSFGVAAVLLAIAVESLRFRRFAVTRAVLAALAAVVLAVLVLWIVRTTAGRDVSHLLDGPTRDAPGLPVVASVAAVVAADLSRSRLRVLARLVIVFAIVSAAVSGSLTVPSAAIAVLVGGAVGTGSRVLLGVVPARPAAHRIQTEMQRAGWPVVRLETLSDLPGRAKFRGQLVDGPPVAVTVVDHDRRGVPFAHRVWRVLRLRSSAVGRPALSLRGQMERQALSGALAQSAGVTAPRSLAMLAVGRALVLVESTLEEAPPAEDSPDAERARFTGAAAALRRMHDVGLTHGTLTSDSVAVVADGEVGFRDLSTAQPASSELQRDLDLVALLVASSTRLGAGPAVAAVTEGYATPAAANRRLAALLQPVGLPGPTRKELKGTHLLTELRSVLLGPDAEAAGVTPPRLERVRTRTLISVIGGAAAAYILATQLSKVSLATALHPEQPLWLIGAVVGSAITYVGAALAKRAFVPVALPLLRTVMVQVASSFVALVTPPAVGHVGINIRYLQRAGVAVPVATASVGISELIVVVVTVVLLIVCAWLSGASGTQLSLLPSSTVVIVLIAAAAVLGVIMAIPPSRRFVQRQIQPLLKRTLPQLLELTSQPRRTIGAVAGAIVLNGGYVLALDASLRAYGQPVSLPVLVVVFLASSTIGSAVPTPGGVGAVEAALIAGLTAAGVPVAGALTGVLAFRAATFWIPAPIGWGVFVGLQRRGTL